MYACILIPHELSLMLELRPSSTYTSSAHTASTAGLHTAASVCSNSALQPGQVFFPDEGEIRLDRLEDSVTPDDDLVRRSYGGYDTQLNVQGQRVRHCNWVRFVRTTTEPDAANIISSKVKGQAFFQVTQPVRPKEEIVVLFHSEPSSAQITPSLVNTDHTKHNNLLIGGSSLITELQQQYPIPRVVEDSNAQLSKPAILSNNTLAFSAVNTFPGRPSSLFPALDLSHKTFLDHQKMLSQCPPTLHQTAPVLQLAWKPQYPQNLLQIAPSMTCNNTSHQTPATSLSLPPASPDNPPTRSVQNTEQNLLKHVNTLYDNKQLSSSTSNQTVRISQAKKTLQENNKFQTYPRSVSLTSPDCTPVIRSEANSFTNESGVLTSTPLCMVTPLQRESKIEQEVTNQNDEHHREEPEQHTPIVSVISSSAKSFTHKPRSLHFNSSSSSTSSSILSSTGRSVALGDDSQPKENECTNIGDVHEDSGDEQLECDVDGSDNSLKDYSISSPMHTSSSSNARELSSFSEPNNTDNSAHSHQLVNEMECDSSSGKHSSKIILKDSNDKNKIQYVDIGGDDNVEKSTYLVKYEDEEEVSENEHESLNVCSVRHQLKQSHSHDAEEEEQEEVEMRNSEDNSESTKEHLQTNLDFSEQKLHNDIDESSNVDFDHERSQLVQASNHQHNISNSFSRVPSNKPDMLVSYRSDANPRTIHNFYDNKDLSRDENVDMKFNFDSRVNSRHGEITHHTTLGDDLRMNHLGMSRGHVDDLRKTTVDAIVKSRDLHQPIKRCRERSWWPCDVCGKKFDRPSLLKRHTRTHTGEKPHACDVCGKAFSTSSSLNTHRRIHSGEKPHQCKVCGKRFTASSNLYYHRMTHNKEKPHKCDLCSKSFPTPGDLRSHKYIHNGSWPFRCNICNRGFSKQTNMKNHMLLHSGDKPHECPLCGKKFALLCNLKTHYKTHEQSDSSDTSRTFCQRCGDVLTTDPRDETSGDNYCSRCQTTEEKFVPMTTETDHFHKKPNKRSYDDTQIPASLVKKRPTDFSISKLTSDNDMKDCKREFKTAKRRTMDIGSPEEHNLSNEDNRTNCHNVNTYDRHLSKQPKQSHMISSLLDLNSQHATKMLHNTGNGLNILQPEQEESSTSPNLRFHTSTDSRSEHAEQIKQNTLVPSPNSYQQFLAAAAFASSAAGQRTQHGQLPQFYDSKQVQQPWFLPHQTFPSGLYNQLPYPMLFAGAPSMQANLLSSDHTKQIEAALYLQSLHRNSTIHH